MRLYIFVPHEEWDYCGGCIIISAEKFDECTDIIKEYALKEQKEEGFSFPCDYWLFDTPNPNVGSAINCWVLKEEFECLSITEKKVILINYNYA